MPDPIESQELTEDGEDRLLPSEPIGRAWWYAKRAGSHPDAHSLNRLTRALDLAEKTGDLSSFRARVSEDAVNHLERLSGSARSQLLQNPHVIDATGGAHTLDVIPASMSAGGITAAADAFIASMAGLAFIPLSDSAMSVLDLESLVGAEASDSGQLRLNHTFTYLPQEGIVVGRIFRRGRHQLHALPKDPKILTTLETIARHWRWIADDPSLRDRSSGQLRSALLDRICQLILCPPDHEPTGSEGPTGGPGKPRRGGRIASGHDRKGSCEDCAEALLGDLETIDGTLQRPPIIKWWGDDRWQIPIPIPPIYDPPYPKWTSVGPFPRSNFWGIGRVNQIDVHPTNGNIVIAGAAGGGVWRTDDAGATWSPCMDLQPTLAIGALAFAPSNPSIIYAASGEDGGGKPGVGVYRSSDGGKTWAVAATVPSTRFSAIVVHPRNADVIYVAGNQGLHKSLDGGATWLTNPGELSLFTGRITDVVISDEMPEVAQALIGGQTAEPIFADRVYIGVRNSGVYRSLTGGRQFGSTPAFTRLDEADQLPFDTEAGWPKLAIGRRGAHRSRFLAAKMGPGGSRIFTTTNGGTTWTEKAADVAGWDAHEYASVIAVDPTDEDVMYAGGAGRFFRTTNGGATLSDWVYLRDGDQPHVDQQDIAFDNHDSRRFYLANDGGVYRTSNRGDDWVRAWYGLAIAQLYDIDISDDEPEVIAGASQDDGVFYRTEGGVWRQIKFGDGTQVAIDPSDNKIFYFANQYGIPPPDGQMGLARSVDGGLTYQRLSRTGLSGSSPWVTIIKLEPRPFVANPAADRVLFVCGKNELFRSTNGGESWNRVENAAGEAFQPVGQISALEFAPGDLRILYLATDDGALYRGVNGGANASDWTRIDTSVAEPNGIFENCRVDAIGVNPKNPNDVWLVFGGDGVWWTKFGDLHNPHGVSHLFRNPDARDANGWEDASGHFTDLSLPDVPTSTVALVDFDPMVAYVGTDIGVFRTTDGGTTWASFQEGLPRSPVVELRFSWQLDRLAAGTMGRGVFVRNVY